MNIKDMVKNNAQVYFEYYRGGCLWYKTEVGDFLFPVPIEDVGDATFNKQDKAMLFMRYIRKYLQEIEAEKNEG